MRRARDLWTPTYASCLNLIEAHFGVLKRFTVANTDDPSHLVRCRRIYRYAPKFAAHRSTAPLSQNQPIRIAELVCKEKFQNYKITNNTHANFDQ